MNILLVFLEFFFLINAEEMICVNLNLTPSEKSLYPARRVVEVSVNCKNHGKGFMQGIERMIEVTFNVYLKSGEVKKTTLIHPPFTLGDAYNIGTDIFATRNITVLKNITTFLKVTDEDISNIEFIQFKTEDDAIIYKEQSVGNRMLSDIPKIGYKKQDQESCFYIESPVIVTVRSCEPFCYGKINCNGTVTMHACKKVSSEFVDFCPDGTSCCPTALECKMDRSIPLSVYEKY